MERESQQPNGGDRHPERPEVNSYGTDDPETQAHIENARVDAARERERDRARLEQLVGMGMTPDNAEAVIEFDHHISATLRMREQASATGRTAPAETEAMPTRNPRVYVVDTASHRRGIRHGLWVDAAREPQELEVDITAMLESSPSPKATEWAIDATSDFAGLDLSGYRDVELISKLARGVAEHGAAYAAWVAIVGTDNRDLLDGFTDFHVGSYDNPEAWAQEVTNDLEWPQQLENNLDPMLRRYVVIDYARFIRDARQSWDVIDGADGKTHVFMR